MTFWLILALTLLAILSPAVWLRPSRRDRRVAALRQAARAANVSVGFSRAPLHEAPGGLASYRWRYPQTRPGPRFVLVREAYASQRLKPHDASWRWRIEPLRPLRLETEQRLRQLLATLPDDALVLKSTRDHLWLWWGESLDASAFTELGESMAILRDSLEGEERKRGAPSAPPR
ncbi:preprotein translocase subunit YajC [Modicisalibacter radicis]|uniref:preprotein translocase subunit YajC n=1 Tax=Halomonas sp. EAR18 TaxID=2518972 RepID=UPI00109C5589|nr:preprotein translocase subunit YajC [Halomonas sp. EAR18]